MKKKIMYLPLMVLTITMLALSSCKKDTTTSTNDDTTSAQDHTDVTNALNTATDDATNAVGGVSALSGKTDGALSICGYSIDSSQRANGIITINFDGTTCTNIAKTGSIKATLEGYAGGTRWKDAGATLKLEFTNVKVTNTVSGANITLNGTHYIVNTTGGLAWKVLAGLSTTTVTHKHIADNFTLTFADGTVRTWSVRRSRTFSASASVITVTVEGDTTISGLSNVEAWGTNRKGDAFTTALTTPIVSNSTCGIHKPVSGQLDHQVAKRSGTILYGVDASGNSITSGCAYGFKITVTVAGKTKTKVVSYW